MTVDRSSFTATCSSPAKVNLCLRVVGKRADGYHLLDSIFAAIDLADRITIDMRNAEPRRATSVVVSCDHPGVPNDATNLAARAATRLLDLCGLGADVTIAIEKQIPVGAGLGGGSSNAAAVLRCLRSFLAPTIDARRLHALALGLGADVPFFLTGGCARVRGIGEDVQAIPGWPALELVVAMPAIAVSTAWAFRSYTAGFPDSPAEPERMAAGAAPDATTMVNDLETVVLPAHPEIGELKRALVAAGATAAVMSGSGSAVIAVMPSGRAPDIVVDRLRTSHPAVTVRSARLVPPEPRVG